MMATEAPAEKVLINGPLEGVSYPIKVQYCGECSMPFEFCEYTTNYAKCKEWLEKNLPEMFGKLQTEEAAAGDEKGDDEKKGGRQKRGGKALKVKKKTETGAGLVKLARSNRGKKKWVTVVSGLGTFEIDLKDASKFFASKFACGSSVTGADEIVIQGDVKDDLFDVITTKWPEIDEDSIEDLGDVKK